MEKRRQTRLASPPGPLSLSAQTARRKRERGRTTTALPAGEALLGARRLTPATSSPGARRSPPLSVPERGGAVGRTTPHPGDLLARGSSVATPLRAGEGRRKPVGHRKSEPQTSPPPERRGCPKCRLRGAVGRTTPHPGDLLARGSSVATPLRAGEGRRKPVGHRKSEPQTSPPPERRGCPSVVYEGGGGAVGPSRAGEALSSSQTPHT